MIRKLSYVMAVVFMFSAIPIEGISQSRDSVERANHKPVKHVVKRKAKKAKNTIKKTWKGTKKGVHVAYDSTKAKIRRQ